VRHGALNDDSALCTGDCKRNTCGDGKPLAGVEQCDDGNLDQGDGCLSGCRKATCGDGQVFQGQEVCDDGRTCTDQTIGETTTPLSSDFEGVLDLALGGAGDLYALQQN